MAREALPTAAPGATRAPGFGEIGGRMVGLRRMRGAIDADADGDREDGSLSPSIRMPATLSPPSKRSFGHFTCSSGPELRRAFGDRVMQRQRGDEGQLRRLRRRRRLGEQKVA